MAILTNQEIRKALAAGDIRIEPLGDDLQIGPASVDLTLGNAFRVFRRHQDPYAIRDDSNFEDITESIHIQDGEAIYINPGEMILGITREKITLADHLCGWLEGRSRFARFGLAVHITAGFMQPGISNQQVLEIVNLGHTTLALYPGTRICQFIFARCEGSARYAGRFKDQASP